MTRMMIRICAVVFAVVAHQGGLASADDSVSSHKLDLGEVTSATVYVSLQNKTPAFSLSKTSGWHSGGLKWSFDKKEKHPKSLTITFQLSSDIKKIKSSSKPRLTCEGVSSATQKCTVTAAKASDSFTVVKSDGGTHDPAIVVTPIN